MHLARGCRHDQGYLLADGLQRGITEQLFCGWIEVFDHALLIDGDNRLDRVIEHRLEAVLAHVHFAAHMVEGVRQIPGFSQKRFRHDDVFLARGLGLERGHYARNGSADLNLEDREHEDAGGQPRSTTYQSESEMRAATCASSDRSSVELASTSLSISRTLFQMFANSGLTEFCSNWVSRRQASEDHIVCTSRHALCHCRCRLCMLSSEVLCSNRRSPRWSSFARRWRLPIIRSEKSSTIAA